jgi:nucleoside diphosphate kinase
MKSRTGGVMARLLSRSDLDLVAAIILTPSVEFAEEYAASIKKTVSQRDEKAAKLLADYVKDNFSPLPDGKRERIMMLLFKGENACEKLFSIAGHLPWFTRKESITGETIRDTYSDLVFLRNGAVKYFEPAVLTPPNEESALEKLRMFSDFAKNHPNIVENIVKAKEGAQRTLVIIKPDNWRHPSSRPGNIIDMLSKTGLRIVGTKIYQMSVEEALEFYGPVKGVLRKKLAPIIGEKAKSMLEEQLNLGLSDGIVERLTESVGVEYADDQFSQIVEFMSGVRPETCPDSDKAAPGKVKCMVLIYEGKDAISKIRDVLGPTDPTKAPGGTVRRDFGSNVMVNTAHASDSPESVEREMNVVKINSNNFSQIIDDFLAQKKK